MEAQTSILLQRAADDEVALRLDGLPDVPFGQHVQGAVEKLLKALINEHGETYRRTHDLTLLETDIAALGESLPTLPIRLGQLTKYAMDFRSDDVSLLPPLDRQACFDAVDILRAYVLGPIQALNPPPPAP